MNEDLKLFSTGLHALVSTFSIVLEDLLKMVDFPMRAAGACAGHLFRRTGGQRVVTVQVLISK